MLRVILAAAAMVVFGCGAPAGGDLGDAADTPSDVQDVPGEVTDTPMDIPADPPADRPGDVPVDSGVTAMITCGAATCVEPQVCCARMDPGGWSLGCSDFDLCDPATEYRLSCDGPEDCETGETCCGTGQQSACRSTPCTGVFFLGDFCHSDADCPDARFPLCCPLNTTSNPPVSACTQPAAGGGCPRT